MKGQGVREAVDPLKDGRTVVRVRIEVTSKLPFKIEGG
jgi:hypothetical protein